MDGLEIGTRQGNGENGVGGANIPFLDERVGDGGRGIDGSGDRSGIVGQVCVRVRSPDTGDIRDETEGSGDNRDVQQGAAWTRKRAKVKLHLAVQIGPGALARVG